MSAQIDHILSKVRPRITAILRTRGKYDTEQLVLQYKTHILGFMEYSCGCISHASKTQLDRLDAAQRRFLHGLQIDERIALRVYNLAPPSLRRGIAIQGLIHKRVLGVAYSAFNSLLPFC